MATTIELDERLQASIDALVRAGGYASPVEVIRDAVRLVQEREARLAELDRMLEAGLASAEAGRLTDADEAFDRLIAGLGGGAERHAA